MIKAETITINNHNYKHTYSDIGNYIIQDQTNIKYEEAIDIFEAPYTYTETNEQIEQFNEQKEIEL